MRTIAIDCETIEDQSWGIARIVRELLVELASRPNIEHSHRFLLYFRNHIPDDPILRHPVFIPRVARLPFIPTLFNVYYHIALPYRVFRDRPDVTFYPNYMLPPLSFGPSVVLTTDDMYYEARGSLPFRYRLAYRLFGGWAIHMATRLMTFSESAQREISRLFNISSERITVNHLGIRVPSKRPVHSKEEPYILFVGQAFPRRHLKESIEAFELLAKDFPDLRFRIVGPDKYPTPIIRPLIADMNARFGSNRIVYKPYVSDEELDNLYAHADALLYVSNREAFGLPPLEAAARGVPPIVADTAVSRELFQEGALYVQSPYTPGAIAERIREALSDQSIRKHMEARSQDVQNTFTWSAFTNRWLACMDNPSS